MKKTSYIVGITGASGQAYGRRIVETLLDKGLQVQLLVTDNARLVIADELGFKLQADGSNARAFFKSRNNGLLRFVNYKDITSPLSSGSSKWDGMFVVPCSMGRLSSMACGASKDLLERLGDVALKEGRRLVLIPRETPLNSIHIENMLRLSHAGARIVPAMPAFYTKPKSVSDMVDFVAGRALDAMGIEHTLYKNWKPSK